MGTLPDESFYTLAPANRGLIVSAVPVQPPSDASELPPPRMPWSERAARFLPFLAVSIAYATVALHAITLPGVYMDAVNPDYLVVKVLNPAHADIVAWVLPGNYLLGNRVPLLIALYHGTQTFWFGLPLFWLLGTSVESLRLTHAALGLCVLAAMYFCLRRLRLGRSASALTCAVLALDPAYSYAFRTQSYITLSGSAWMLLSVGLLCSSQSRRRWWLSGLFAGLGMAAYFVHGFFLAALVPAVWVLSAREGAVGNAISAAAVTRWRARGAWLGGLVLGTAPYIVGYLLLMRRVGGPRAFLDYYRQQAGALEVLSSGLTVPGRIGFAWDMLIGVVTNAWHHSMMFGEWVAVPGSPLKIALLIFAPVALWAFAEWRRNATGALRLVLAMPVAFFVVSLIFGSRLGGHHYVVLLPFLYAALALAWRDAMFSGGGLHGRRAAGALSLAALMAGVNVVGQVAEARVLERTGGVKLMSDAINRFAADLNATPRKPFAFFPDWGLALPVEFLTRGNIGMDTQPDFKRARAILCAGQDVGVALIEDRAARRATWTRELEAEPSAVIPYRQRDGTVVFDFAVYGADPRHPRCGHGHEKG